MKAVGNGVFTLIRPKQDELVFVRKFDNEFVRDGYPWQAFKMCTSKSPYPLRSPAPYHFCCMTCGNYMRFPLYQKMTFVTEHTHKPLDIGVERNPAYADAANVTEEEAPSVLFFSLIKFVCNSNLAFAKASSKFLTALIREAIVIGRIFPEVPAEILFPEVNGAKLSEQANFMGYNKQSAILSDLRGKKVAILMDAGKSMLLFFLFFLSHIFFFC
jgi:hypothetical protein